MRLFDQLSACGNPQQPKFYSLFLGNFFFSSQNMRRSWPVFCPSLNWGLMRSWPKKKTKKHLNTKYTQILVRGNIVDDPPFFVVFPIFFLFLFSFLFIHSRRIRWQPYWRKKKRGPVDDLICIMKAGLETWKASI